MSESAKQKVEFIFRIIDVAEMKQVDFSFITGISRETIHRWKKGHNVADQLRLTGVLVRADDPAAARPVGSRCQRNSRRPSARRC